MTARSSNSVTLKINKTSVMLYANLYLRLADRRGASSQIYLSSFPKTATEIPSKFEDILRESTVGRPARYFAIRERIENEVLIPARKWIAEEQARQNLNAINNALTWSKENMTTILNMSDYDKLIELPEPQQLLVNLGDACNRLTSRIKPSVPVVAQNSALDNATTGEGRLKTLLADLENICLEIGRLLPESAQAFKRGYVFDEETVSLVKRNWFRASDVIARLGSRAQFRRPAGWSALRATVLQDETE